MTMYARKLVKSGLCSNVISLPKDFLNDNKLKSGDTIILERKGRDKLLVGLHKGSHEEEKKEKRTIEITVGNRPINHTERDIIAAYISNYNEIVIKYNTHEEALHIKRFISYLVALEVVQEEKNKIIAKDFLNYKDRDIERILRRIEHIVLTMLTDLELAENERTMTNNIEERDKDVNRLGFLVMRILQVAAVDNAVASELDLDVIKIIRLWTLNIQLERIGDECKRIGRLIPELKQTPQQRKQFYIILDELIAHFENTFKAIHTVDKNLMDKNLDWRKQIFMHLEDYRQNDRSITGSKIRGLMRNVLSHLTDISRAYRYGVWN